MGGSTGPTGPAEHAAAEAKAAFHLRLRARGVQDHAVLRAFELVPRHKFVPPHLADLAGSDVALPIACGQTLHPPTLIARMIEALDIEPAHRVLEIGSGSGYTTAVLAHLCREVVGVERFNSLALAAQARLAALGLINAVVTWGDGLAEPLSGAIYDRVLVHGCLDQVPAAMLGRLVEGGVLVCAQTIGTGQAVVCLRREPTAPSREVMFSCRLDVIRSGRASIL